MKGKKRKFIAWVHPAVGGDDYPVAIHTYAVGMAEARRQVVKELKVLGSAILNDFGLAK